MTASSAATCVSLDGALGCVQLVDTQTDKGSEVDVLTSGLSLVSDKEDTNTDPRYTLPKCVIPNGMEPVELFVSKAVAEQNAQPKNSPPVPSYRGLLEAFRNPDDLELLRKVMIALRTSGTTLHMLTSESNQHARLIHAIMRFVSFPPTSVVTSIDQTISENDENDYSIADAQLHLIMALVSANSVFLIPALTIIWKMLVSQVWNAQEARTQRLHAALATLIRLCPKARTELFPVIATNTPFRLRPEAEIVWYYRQCLRVLDYLSTLRTPIIHLIIEKSIEIDVEIKIADGGQVTIEHDDNLNNAFQLDDERETNVNNSKELQEVDAQITVDEMAEKLDSLMFLLMEYVEKAVRSGSSVIDIYNVLTRAFENTILLTNKSKFVQYLLFHICGLDSQTKTLLVSNACIDETNLYREFAAKLIDIILDPYRATVMRQSSACYLASYISRATFVCAETVCESIDALLQFAEAYVKSVGALYVSAVDKHEQCNAHSLFYTVCQSAFYIMCFRGVEVIKYCRKEIGSDERPSYLDLGASRWTTLCSHSLQPLRYCLESVRTEFLRLSKIFELMSEDVLDKLDYDSRYEHRSPRKKKKVIQTAATLQKERMQGGVGGLGQGMNPLDSFFPFDPYLLRKSHEFIEPFYKHWDGGAFDSDIEKEVGDAIDDGESSEKYVGESEGEDTEGALVHDSSDTDDDEEEDDELGNAKRERLFSITSNASSVASQLCAPDVLKNRAEMAQLWSNTLKRARAPSIEKGSW